MKIHILFGQRKEAYDGEYAPEVLLAWDEYMVDDNPEGWERELEAQRKIYGTQMIAMRVIDIEVDQDRIRKLLVDTPTLKAKIVQSYEIATVPAPVRQNPGDF